MAVQALFGFCRREYQCRIRDPKWIRISSTMAASADNELRPVFMATLPAKSSSSYPSEFQSMVRGRTKRALGQQFGLQNFGVNHTTLVPGASSALQHYHAKQDELIVILSGTATLKLGDDEILMTEGMCMGFPAGRTVGHCVVNRSDTPVTYLEIGDRTPADVVTYPEDDLRAVASEGGQWKFYHKDGRPYDDGKEEKH
jgi:uncharacterized cupin superfamily protein